ncbi:hypothetical protein [Litchfieldia salsa]|uniref:Uncharacterized protein n=1 Tax=Litchfieldia salsa TaxID=930152 RepID=A0A1H0W5L5_9BACI|nr:hypothetical protein [Litchfieldia salsa]SDP86020.1 hypothetical protein SAMN05216565_10997 [Litchfieldia salsa]
MSINRLQDSTIITKEKFIDVLKAAYETGEKKPSMSATDLINEIAQNMKQLNIADNNF